MVASSNKIEDDDNDPPCIGAKREYEGIVSRVSGKFVCIGETPGLKRARVFEVTGGGLVLKALRSTATASSGAVGATPLHHG